MLQPLQDHGDGNYREVAAGGSCWERRTDEVAMVEEATGEPSASRDTRRQVDAGTGSGDRAGPGNRQRQRDRATSG